MSAQIDTLLRQLIQRLQRVEKTVGILNTLEGSSGGDVGGSVNGATTDDTVSDTDTFPYTTGSTLKKTAWLNIKSLLTTVFNAVYAPIAKGVTNGDSHDHSGGDGAQIDHTTLSNIGTNTHAQIDTHIAASVAHGVSGNVVGTTDTQTLTNKTLTNPTITVRDDVFTLQDNLDPTKQIQFQVSPLTTGTTRVMNFPDQTDTLVGRTVAQTITNKTFTSPTINTPTITVNDSAFTLQDQTDTSKKLLFELSGLTTATTRTLTAPDASTTLVGTGVAQTLTNKTLDSTNIASLTAKNPPIDADSVVIVDSAASNVFKAVTYTNVKAFLRTYLDTIYLVLAGVSGGQTAKGGTGSGENLTLMSTAHATKGKVLIGAGGYDEANDKFGVGLTSMGASRLGIKTGGASNDAAAGGVLYVDSATRNSSGSTETDLGSYTVPADTLNTNGMELYFEVWGTTANNGNAKTIKIYFDTDVFTIYNAVTWASATWRIVCRVVRTGSSAQNYLFQAYNDNTTASFFAIAAGTRNFASGNVLKVTGTGTATNDVRQRYFKVWWNDNNT